MVRGKEFRETLHRPLPNAPVSKGSCRIVEAFTAQALQKATCVLPPPASNPYKECLPTKPTIFKRSYLRSEIPICANSKRSAVVWNVDINTVNWNYMLPLFFEGLSEVEEPYKFIAFQGIQEVLTKCGSKIFPVVPSLIIPIKNALHTKNKTIMLNTLKVIQMLVKCNANVGAAMVPYYRQILPTLNLFKEKNVNCGDGIDYTQMNGKNLADAINETLIIMETYGGEDAFINIKYLIPTYESAVMN